MESTKILSEKLKYLIGLESREFEIFDLDVDVYDNPSRKTPDENVMSAPEGAKVASKKLIAKQKGELKHYYSRLYYRLYRFSTL